MKAQTWHGGAHFTLDDIPEPEPSPGYVLVELDTTGICGTDVHVTQGAFSERSAADTRARKFRHHR